jgi:Rieske Fe-S protein
MYVSADGLPYIGKASRGGPVHVATGYGGDGVPFSAVAARLITAGIARQHSLETDLFSPHRIKPIASARKFIRENADVARHFVGDRLTPADERGLDELERGEGRLVQLGLRKVAAYRDANGTLHVLRPVCAHLKCIVHWNAAEASWDCPCHGARYDVDGKPIDGPSLANLEPYDLPQPIDKEPAPVTDMPANIQPAT